MHRITAHESATRQASSQRVIHLKQITEKSGEQFSFSWKMEEKEKKKKDE